MKERLTERRKIGGKKKEANSLQSTVRLPLVTVSYQLSSVKFIRRGRTVWKEDPTRRAKPVGQDRRRLSWDSYRRRRAKERKEREVTARGAAG